MGGWNGEHPVLRPTVRALSAVAVEVGWVGAHLVTYPLGLLRDRGDDPDPARFRFGDLPLAQRGLIGADVQAATTPIVLIHGIVDNRTIFAMLRRGLRRRGFGCIRSFSYGPHTNDLRTTARRFGDFVESVADETGSDRVHVIVPARNARIDHRDLDVRNVLVHGVGHLSLPINGRIVHETCATLAMLSAPVRSNTDIPVQVRQGRTPA